MSILKEYEKINQSKLYKLTLNGKTLGIRACIYSIQESVFEYYDFSISTIKNKDLQVFLNSKKSKFESLDLTEVNGVYLTQDEIVNKTVIKEFKDDYSTEKVLSSFMEIYN